MKHQNNLITCILGCAILHLVGCITPTEKTNAVDVPVNEWEIAVDEEQLFARLAEQLITNPNSLYEEQKNIMINYALDALWDVQFTESGLCYQIVKQGEGAPIQWGDDLQAHYEGKFLNGEIFDSSYERMSPLSFKVGTLIDGWNEALQLINKGGKIRVLVPSHLGYGEKGFIIPPNDTLVPPNEVLAFRLEVLNKMR